MLKAFVIQNLWTIYHAIKWPPGYHRDYWSLVRPCWALWISAAFSKQYRLWIIPGLFFLVFLIVPTSRFVLPAIPFVCLLAVNGYMNVPPISKWLLLISFAMSLGPSMTQDLIRPWRDYLGFRAYSLMDTRYIADQLDAMEMEPPIWTNDCDLYLAMNWEVPVNDFYDIAEVPGAVVDWGIPPFSEVKTRVELLPTATDMGQEPDKIPGWRTEVFPLNRGQFTKIRIRRRI